MISPRKTVQCLVCLTTVLLCSMVASYGVLAGAISEFSVTGEDAALTLAETASPSSKIMDAANYTNWANHYGVVGENTPGDFDHNGLVDNIDKLHWIEHFGHEFSPSTATNSVISHVREESAPFHIRSVGFTPAFSFAAVPEPGSLAMAGVALLTCCLFTRRRSSIH